MYKTTSQSKDRRNFESLHVLFVICARVTTLQLCYMRMHSFSANQKRVISSGTLLISKNVDEVFLIFCVLPDEHRNATLLGLYVVSFLSPRDRKLFLLIQIILQTRTQTIIPTTLFAPEEICLFHQTEAQMVAMIPR